MLTLTKAESGKPKAEKFSAMRRVLRCNTANPAFNPKTKGAVRNRNGVLLLVVLSLLVLFMMLGTA